MFFCRINGKLGQEQLTKLFVLNLQTKPDDLLYGFFFPQKIFNNHFIHIYFFLTLWFHSYLQNLSDQLRTFTVRRKRVSRLHLQLQAAAAAAVSSWRWLCRSSWECVGFIGQEWDNSQISKWNWSWVGCPFVLHSVMPSLPSLPFCHVRMIYPQTDVLRPLLMNLHHFVLFSAFLKVKV